MTTIPCIETVLIMRRIASTAAWSAAFLSPRPIQRDAKVAADSVTRTSSSARLRSGTARSVSPTCLMLHPLRRPDSDQIEAARDHQLRRAAEREPERLVLGFEHAVLVVEAVEVVGDADRICGDRVGPAAFSRFTNDFRELEQPLHQLALLGLERRCELSLVTLCHKTIGACVAKDSGDAGVRVLDVVDRVLLRLLGRQVDVDL